ncbi:hypothetical protein [Marinobacterium aestuariivivens]|uniref:Uncharacterized protein n=1 Tax=Marinobacterium aestuariivivens TaxID=1698799 RepID=A0ABW1ZW99_9GAMM
MSLGLCSHCAGGRAFPRVAPPGGDALYTLPLTEPQLIDVFGPADRSYRANEVRY